MPLSKIQSDVLRVLAAHRDPENFIASQTPPFDIFLDRAARVAPAALADAETIAPAGYMVSWLRREPLFYSAALTKNGEGTRLDWVVDGDYRFFPAIRDESFGCVLHPIDIAMNKVMTAVGRGELRDIIDLLTIHETILPLGAVIWAAVEKAPGFTPEGLIAEIRRTSNYPRSEWNKLVRTEPIDPLVVMPRLRAILDEAEAFVMKMPTEKAGLLFLDGGRVVQPDPERLEDYQTHAGQRRGQWPSSPEISAAMMERYKLTS